MSEEVKTAQQKAQDIIDKALKKKKADDEDEVLSQGFESYKFTPFPKN